MSPALGGPQGTPRHREDTSGQVTILSLSTLRSSATFPRGAFPNNIGSLKLEDVEEVSCLILRLSCPLFNQGSGNPIAPKILDLIVVVFSAPGKKFL